MTQTKTEIATLALRTLGVVPEEQVPTAFQMATATAGVTRAHAELAYHSIAYWDVDACPEGVASAFADYVAGDLAPLLATQERIPHFQARMIGAMRRMSAVTARRDNSDAPVKFEDF